MRVCKTGITIVMRDHLRIPMCAQASCPPGVSVRYVSGDQYFQRSLLTIGARKRKKGCKDAWVPGQSNYIVDRVMVVPPPMPRVF